MSVLGGPVEGAVVFEGDTDTKQRGAVFLCLPVMLRLHLFLVCCPLWRCFGIWAGALSKTSLLALAILISDGVTSCLGASAASKLVN